jgi:signal transduction histidine kinase/type II secretory pathway pseudopilin PulG
MISGSRPNEPKVRSFRTKLLAAMMLVVSGLMALALYLAQRHVAAAAQSNLQQNFQAELSSLDKVRELRNAALAERCGTLVSRPRIHAALEDNALDLLYPSAKDELRDLMETAQPSRTELFLRAKFYRFLNPAGQVLSPPNPKDVGELSPKAERQLTLKKLPETQQIGYILETPDDTDEIVDEIVAAPIFSTETGDVISALVVGFKPFELIGKAAAAGMKSGIWLNGRLHMPSLSKSSQAALGNEIANAIANSDRVQNNFRVDVDDAPHLLFYKRLNPTSLFPPAYEICVYPLTDSMAHLHRLQWQIGSVGVLLLLGGFVASQIVAARLSLPVEKLAVDSEKNRAQRKRAEAALASTSEELKRSARYSADASHQLKSPVTVLRVGLEKLLGREDFKPDVYEEISSLLHQTHRLTGVIDDLLLLSRMDAGHLQIASTPVNVSRLVDEWLDDLGALPDSPDVKIEKEFPDGLFVAGEKRYTSLIVQNLLENARKYNRPGGRIRVSAHGNPKDVVLTVGNTGRTIPPDENIFERFHHRSTPSVASGHGIGLNLARELARLHGGNLRLVRSENDWTEFEVRFPAANGINAVG